MANLGHTQFLPGNALAYGVDGDGDGRIDLTNLPDAMATTANYLRAKGLEAGQGLSGGRAQLRRDQGMERGHRLSAGHRPDGSKNRQLRHAFPSCSARAVSPSKPPRGPFVYRLGHLVFNQARGVRLPYGLPLFLCKILILREFSRNPKPLPKHCLASQRCNWHVEGLEAITRT